MVLIDDVQSANLFALFQNLANILFLSFFFFSSSISSSTKKYLKYYSKSNTLKFPLSFAAFVFCHFSSMQLKKKWKQQQQQQPPPNSVIELYTHFLLFTIPIFAFFFLLFFWCSPPLLPLFSHIKHIYLYRNLNESVILCHWTIEFA